MQLRYRTINEDRGARRAAELRDRFRHVSDASINHPQFGLRHGAQARTWSEVKSRQSQFQELMAWSVLAVVMVFIGMMML
ncbi:hypothetical protein [Roseibium aggregatum]|uniref:hypothetical protein n=1 Tax=Roseibium aggregatum TaxID=187304 RepID=UPI001A8FD582|nr:hypothetical protein [Roseibium aggregatum]MBN8183847.1 hypothetical protein [Roseibium aggregatum]UES42914.1 hypothetical protein GFK90_03600 [Roseibium aggregatum]